MITESMMTVPEVAKLFRCTTQHVYNSIKQGKIKAIFFGGVKIKESEVLRILNSGERSEDAS